MPHGPHCERWTMFSEHKKVFQKNSNNDVQNSERIFRRALILSGIVLSGSLQPAPQTETCVNAFTWSARGLSKQFTKWTTSLEHLVYEKNLFKRMMKNKLRQVVIGRDFLTSKDSDSDFLDHYSTKELLFEAANLLPRLNAKARFWTSESEVRLRTPLRI